MKRKLPLILLSIVLPAAGETLISYDAGVPAAAGEAGAADPAGQGWAFGGGGGNFAAGYDSGDGGWRTVDATGGSRAEYSAALDALTVARLATADTVTLRWTVALDPDAVGLDGTVVADYYLAPDNGRQNDVFMVLDVNDLFRFWVTHRVSAADELVLDYNQGQAELNTGVVISGFPSFVEVTLVYDAGAGTATLSYDAGGGNSGELAGLAPGADPNRSLAFMGSGSTGGQGSAVWNSFSVEVPDPVAGDQLVWTGAVDGIWDVATTENWKLADDTPVSFDNGDEVSFDDGGATGMVSVSGAVEPGGITVNNEALEYTLGGEPLGGFGVLRKLGPGTLLLTANHEYVGGTTIEAGAVIAGDGVSSGEVGRGPLDVAAGASLTIRRSDLLDYKLTPKLRRVSGPGEVILEGGVTLFNYTGSGTGFAEPGSWAGFDGRLVVRGDSEFQTIRNGSTAMGTGTVVLGDQAGSGSLSQIEGNWTWTNPIQVVGADNRIVNRSANPPRILKLQGIISGAGNLTFEDAAGSMTDPDRGFILTADNAVSGLVTIAAGVPVRVGGVPGEVDVFGPGINADAFGSLGAGPVANEGTLTFSRTDAHQVDASIGGAGELRIGIPTDSGLGDTSTQVVTISGDQPWTGNTTVVNGELAVPEGSSLASLLVSVDVPGTLSGGGTLAGDLELAGTLAPGGSVGTLNCGGIATMFGDSLYRWEIAGWESGEADLLEANELEVFTAGGGPVTLVVVPAGLDDFSESDRSFPIARSTNGVFNFTAGDVVVDGSAFAEATGASGSWEVRLSGDSLGLELVYTPGSATDYDLWAAGFGLDPTADGAPDGDPDGDGLANDGEYAFGLDPTSAASVTPVGEGLAAGGTLVYSRRDPALSGLSYTVETSTDLVAWTTDAGASQVPGAPVGGVEEVVVTLTAAPAEGRLFARILAR